MEYLNISFPPTLSYLNGILHEATKKIIKMYYIYKCILLSLITLDENSMYVILLKLKSHSEWTRCIIYYLLYFLNRTTYIRILYILLFYSGSVVVSAWLVFTAAIIQTKLQKIWYNTRRLVYHMVLHSQCQHEWPVQGDEEELHRYIESESCDILHINLSALLSEIALSL